MPDSQSTYRVVFWGGLMLGQERLQVAKSFARQFRIRQPRQLQQLFSGRLLTLKSGMPYAEAKRYSDAIRRMGATCRIELEYSLLNPRAHQAESKVLAVATTGLKPEDVATSQRDINHDSYRLVADQNDTQTKAKDPFAARDLISEQHPPCKYFDAREASHSVAKAQKRL
ncbi:MAG: hypothetical protein CL693_13410 [Cellvibrionaceae bacterium]|nr:hypothetical protein [Cellvibrionaceae bacterium]|tara:strand:+ start:4439 stop:4948 length:510 start_codon:yes stop_codon:yes gene_type:complete